MSVSGTNNEEIIYLALSGAGLNRAAICGILANIESESTFNPKALQDKPNSNLVYESGDAYTHTIDRGNYTQDEFAGDDHGYGLIQWTFKTRKSALYTYLRDTKRVSIGDLNAQVEFMIKEMKSSQMTSSNYNSMKVWEFLKEVPNTSTGAYTAAYYFCLDYERPSDKENKAKNRAVDARDKYWRYYENATISERATPNIGQQIVLYARDQLGKPYYENMSGLEYFDNIGLVVASYNSGGEPLPAYLDAKDLYDSLAKENKYKSVSVGDAAAADLVFYRYSRDVYEVGIATGDGNVIITSMTKGEVVEIPISSSNLSSIIRIVADSETSQGEIPTDTGDIGSNAIDYLYLSSNDPYSDQVSRNLSKVQLNNYTNYKKTGYLIDMMHGGAFEFILPEFTEQAGVEWSDVDLRGRSVSVKAYNKTNSRNINISLELYAGEGLYDQMSLKDAVDKMHRDADFVKSLEYPDYSNAIVRPPATIHLILGHHIDFLGVVHDVSVEHLKPLDDRGRSMYIKLSFIVTQIAINPPDYADIRAGRYTSEDYQISSSFIGGEIK